MTATADAQAAAAGATGGLSAGRVSSAAWWALAPLLVGTFTGTLNNNIVNVPLKVVMRDLHVPLAEGALVVIAFNLTFAVLMPITGWLGDRIGRRRVFCAAVLLLTVGAGGAAVAPSLPVLVGCRVLQGAATAAILPTVMGLIAQIFGSAGRGRALGLWAATNGLGQAVGPPVGGLLAGWFGWRSIFWPAIPLGIIAFLGALRFVPAGSGTALRLDWAGALTLTVGAASVLGAATAIPREGAGSALVVTLLLAGVALLGVFGWWIRRASAPFIPPGLLAEPSYLRSSLAVFAQMFCLGTTLLAAPLYLTGAREESTLHAGLIVFALPVAMTVLAPVAGAATERFGPRYMIRAGLVILLVGEAAVGAEFVANSGRDFGVIVALFVAGSGVAFVQTPAATGATRSETGRLGAGLGLFNLLRFAGSALGAAWVAIVLSGGGSYGVLFGVCVVAAAVGIAGTFAGPSPVTVVEPTPAAGGPEEGPISAATSASTLANRSMRCASQIVNIVSGSRRSSRSSRDTRSSL